MPVQTSFVDLTGPAGSDTTTASERLSAVRLQALIHELILLNRYLPVIVEGARDTAALRTLGLQGTIVQLHGGERLASFAERMSHRWPAVITLLDWDRRGKQLHKQLTHHLESAWEPYHYVRQELIALCAPAITTVEELPRHVANQGIPLDTSIDPAGQRRIARDNRRRNRHGRKHTRA